MHIGLNKRTSGSARTGGFTVVELCLGLVITAMVLGAVASFTLAMAQSWRSSEQTEAGVVQARHTAMRIARIVQEAELLGAVYNDLSQVSPTAAIVWVHDSNGNEKIEPAECGMLEYDPSTEVLRYYYPGQGSETTCVSWDIFSDPQVLSNFKVGRDSHAIARNVQSMRFARHHHSSSSISPTLEYLFTVATRGGSHSEYGACSVRAPAKLPS